MTDKLIEQSDGFRIGTKPSDDEIDRANWLIDRLSARILADAKVIEAAKELAVSAHGTIHDDADTSLVEALAAFDELTRRHYVE
jgi:hypothetical protein